MIDDQMKQWVADLLKQQQQAFADQMRQMQSQMQQPKPEPVDFDTDPEQAVLTLAQRQFEQMMNPFRQQLDALNAQLKQPRTDPVAEAWRKAALPEPDEIFDAEMIGIGNMTWGDVRKAAESSGDAAALQQYTSELKSFRAAGKQADVAIPAARARVSFPSGSEPVTASDDDVNADLSRLMQGRLSKEDFDKKYGVKA